MMRKGLVPILTALTFSIVFTFLQIRTVSALELGQLQCSENGVYPDDKLIGLVMQKCQPKLDDAKDILIACVTKCVLKQMKALTKKGKIKKGEAMKLASIIPDGYQEEGKEKFEQCYKEHHSKIKKESKCDSWVPFSSCFMDFAESLCKSATTTEAP